MHGVDGGGSIPGCGMDVVGCVSLVWRDHFGRSTDLVRGDRAMCLQCQGRAEVVKETMTYGSLARSLPC